MHDAFETTLCAGVEFVVVDAHHHGHVGAIGRGRNDDPPGAGFEMLCRGLAPGEDAGAFERHIDAEFAPRQFRRVALGGDADLAAADIHPIVAGRDLAGKAAMHAVVPQQVRIGFDRAEIIDPNDVDLGVPMLVSRAQDEAADAAETVDRNPHSHGLLLPKKLSPIYRSERAASATFSGVIPKCG